MSEVKNFSINELKRMVETKDKTLLMDDDEFKMLTDALNY